MTAPAPAAPIGFIGLGLMGEPMALNLARAGTPLLVWNRSPAKYAALARAGAIVAGSVDEVFTRCDLVIAMLLDEAALDGALGRSGRGFEVSLAGRTLVNMATTAPAYSEALQADIRAAGGRYVEAPVSGSRTPAEKGQLVAMLAGEPEAVAAIHPMLAPMCRVAITCGAVPSALNMKLAVNLFMIAMVTGLVEAAHFAGHLGLDLGRFVAILDAGPMASDLSRIKAAKLLARDYTAQAAIANVLGNTRLITEAARGSGIASPLIDACHALYGETQAMGLGAADIIAVARAIERREEANLAGVVRSRVGAGQPHGRPAGRAHD